MNRPALHLICNAHLDPVWQWRWEEGCAETLATFQNAADILDEHPRLIFNHNEAVLYQWVRRYDPALFRRISKHIRGGRWCISGGWYLQPDVNLPGMESLLRHIAEGRRFFREAFGAEPRVAYNFDSFGHSGGLPQILRRSGYRMYIHMRPQEPDLLLPSDLYRWRGVDGSEILTYRIAVGLYHTERDNIEDRLRTGAERALHLKRDVPVFWGIGNHGGGATHEDLERIDAFIASEHRVRVLHSTTERLYQALSRHGAKAPVVEGDLQRVFTGCYTSISRLKRRAQRSLGELVQAESLAAIAWWMRRDRYPSEDLADIWRDHLFNDFHDILPGSCTESAEQDALDQYGRASESLRRLRLKSVVSFRQGAPRKMYVPVTVVNTAGGGDHVPVEMECMLDLRPKWSGEWHLRAYGADGREVPCQEEQPESLLPFNGWRRKVSLLADLPHTGLRQFELRIHEGRRESSTEGCPSSVDPVSGLFTSLRASDGRDLLSGPLLRPLVMEDDGDAWGADRWRYRTPAGEFIHRQDRMIVLGRGPIRTVTESIFEYGKSTVVVHTIEYPGTPLKEFRLRIQWNESRKRLKLSIPTRLTSGRLFCEVPGGAIHRPTDGDEHVHGRWCMISGDVEGRTSAVGVAHTGLHGLDCLNGELRLSVLRSAAYCHEQGFALGAVPFRKFMDQGTHDVRLFVVTGSPDEVVRLLPGLADRLSAPPLVFAHLPAGSKNTEMRWCEVSDPTVCIRAIKRSWDGRALIVRLHEAIGRTTRATLLVRPGSKKIRLSFRPFEIKTIRIARGGSWRAVDPIAETPR